MFDYFINFALLCLHVAIFYLLLCLCSYVLIAEDLCVCLQCFDAVGWVSGRHPACKNLSDEVLDL